MYQNLIPLCISIHAPAKGATLKILHWYMAQAHFNPRSREGSDLFSFLFFQVITYFNPRSREGSDVKCCNCGNITKNFNPRSREGSDNIAETGNISRRYFNPRSREGSDSYSVGKYIANRIFQSTLPRRERLCVYSFRQNDCCISIHAPAKGATNHWIQNINQCWDFNPRSREGSDGHWSGGCVEHGRFQSTLPRRERRYHFYCA